MNSTACMHTIMAFKPDSEDYCRGYVMASYPSDFRYITTPSMDDAVTFLADLVAINEGALGANEDGFEFTYLLDGVEMPIDNIYALAHDKAVEIVDKWARDEAQALKEKKLKEQEQKTKQDLARLAELKKQYEG